jgi:hypothetical protein
MISSYLRFGGDWRIHFHGVSSRFVWCVCVCVWILTVEVISPPPPQMSVTLPLATVSYRTDLNTWQRIFESFESRKLSILLRIIYLLQQKE